MQSYNYIPFVNVASLTVKRKGKVIKRETQAAIAAAYAERRAQRNAAKRARKALRAA